MSVAVVTGADRGLGLGIAKALLERGWSVVAGQYLPEWTELEALGKSFPDDLTMVPFDVSSLESCKAAAEEVGPIDMIVANAGILGSDYERTVSEGLNYPQMIEDYNINALGPLRTIEAFLPLLAGSAMKRICIVSSEAGSIGSSRRNAWFGYNMSKAATNMAAKNLFNDLRPKGYTFRLYHPGWIKSYMQGVKNEQAIYTPEEGGRMAADYFCSVADEDKLVLRTFDGIEMPW